MFNNFEPIPTHYAHKATLLLFLRIFLCDIVSLEVEISSQGVLTVQELLILQTDEISSFFQLPFLFIYSHPILSQAAPSCDRDSL